MILSRTVASEATAEVIISRSRFIGHIARADSKEEADRFIRSVREEHKSATHNVPCFLIGEKQELKWASDDGEPSGTSGMPMVQMLEKEGITNVVLVVTRYFGGIKLGTGGLVRAYTETAAKTLKAAGIKEVREMYVVRYSMAYNFLPKLQNLERTKNFTIEEVEYGEDVKVTIAAGTEEKESIRELLGDLTCGRGKVLSEEEKAY